MKPINTLYRIIVLLVFFSSPAAIMAQNHPAAKLEFVNSEIDLGKLYVDELELTKLTIEFSNSGNQPLVVSSARGCCGTRILEWTKEPVLPGEKGTVNVEFRLNPRPHMVNRTVSVLSNDPDEMKVFRIKGEVVERESVIQQTGTLSGPRAQ